jgi:predicted PurR-regulated permease PerM
VAAAYLLVRAVAQVASVLILIVLALVFALGLDPVVALLTRRGISRRVAVAIVSVVFLLILAGLLAAVIPPIVTQVEQFSRQAPDLVRQLGDRSTALGRLNARYHLQERLQQQVTAGGGQLSFGGLVGVGTAVLSTVTGVVTVLVLTVYFLANLPGLRGTAYRMAPASRRDRIAVLGDEALARVGGYVLGNIITSVVAGLGTLIFLEVAGVPYPVALGLLVAVLDLIPVVGSTVGGVLVTLVALTVSPTTAIASAIFYVLYRLGEDYLLTPRVMNRTVHVPPMLTIVALLLGAGLLGIVGAFLAIPAAAAVELVVIEVIWPRLDRA